MKKKFNLSLPIIIIVIGLILAVALCLITNIAKKPVITEHDFNFSITYKLNGETQTYNDTYRCEYAGLSNGIYPLDRFYNEYYLENNNAEHPSVYTIAKKGNLSLQLITTFSSCYLMGDTENDSYQPYLDDPYLAVYDEENYNYVEIDDITEFDVELISWEFPEPIENSFVFGGFSVLYHESMLAMLLAGVLAIIASVIFVKKDADVVYKPIDKVSTVFNFALGFAALPFMAFFVWLSQAFAIYDWLEQIFLCVPAATAFFIAASVSLRRKGYSVVGFLIQLIGPCLFAFVLILETVLINFR